MISEKTLVSNRCFLKTNLKRLEEALKDQDDGTFRVGDQEFEKGGALNPKDVARQNHEATKALRDDTVTALKRMTEGKYGICVECESEIGEDRLIARPEASRCIKCQSKKGLMVR